MKKPRKSFTMVLNPHLPLAQGVAHFSIGILSKGYPAPPGEKRFAAQDAIKLYGTDLFQTIHNVYAEALSTGQAVSIRVSWDDGKPVVMPLKRGLIITPPSMN